MVVLINPGITFETIPWDAVMVSDTTPGLLSLVDFLEEPFAGVAVVDLRQLWCRRKTTWDQCCEN